MERRHFMQGVSLGGLAALGTAAAASAPAPHALANGHFHVELDPANGSVRTLVHPADAAAMSWVGNTANAPWQPRSLQWGLGYADLGPSALHRGRWEEPVQTTASADTLRTVYQVGALQVEVTRTLRDEVFTERYVFTNTGKAPLPLNGEHGAGTGMAITAPFNDHYTDTRDVLEHRCHTHLWMGGNSAWVAALRMGGRPPHLGLVLTEGSLASYSITGRDEVTSSNTRGTFLLHPALGPLPPGQSVALAWTLFWHAGWDDFFARCAQHSPTFVLLQADRYTAHVGETFNIAATGRSLAGARLTTGNAAVPLTPSGAGLAAELKADKPGEIAVSLLTGNGASTRLRLNVVPPLDALIEARVRFIVARQQVRDATDPLDGAFLTYDNDLNAIARHNKKRDHNEARERTGMGVLLARWLRTQAQRPPEVMDALTRYYRFHSARLQRADGYVFDGAGLERQRLYNWPWTAQLHLEMGRLTGDAACYDAFVRTLESYYAEGGDAFYAIGLPVFDGLNALRATGRTESHARLLALFKRHGEKLAATGLAYPASEVNFEQSIVAPAAQILLELHSATGEARWLDAAKPHLALLELFNGRQPDHHLHDVAIRHWDGHWFGKLRLWGDTFPHYWSTLTALAFAHYARSGAAGYAQRADAIVRNNLSLFTPEGRASAAFVYPKSVNGQLAHVADPLANDQDWALVHALQLREI